MLNRSLSYLISKLPESNRFERIWKLAQVDFKKRYYNDKLGLFWAFLNPVFRVLIYYLVFTLVFERVADGIENYALFLFSGLIFWMVFAEVSKKGMKVLQQKSYLIENIAVDKVDLYISNGLAGFIGFLFNLFAYSLVAALMGVTFSANLLFLPIIILNLFLLSLGTSMILSVMYINAKDVNHLIDIIFLFGFWSSGIFFRGEKFLELFPPFLYINPFVGLIMNVRNIILFDQAIDTKMMAINLMYGIVVLYIGIQLVHKFSHYAIEKI